MNGFVLIPRKPHLQITGLGWAWWHGTVMFECLYGHRTGYDLKAHTINERGEVSPSTVCPEDGCTYHVYAQLMDWKGDEGLQATAPAGPGRS